MVEEKLISFVEEKCINKQALAQKSGVDFQTLYRCLRGEQRLKADEFLAICRVLEVDPKIFQPNE